MPEHMLHENPVTGERVVVLTDPADHPQDILVAQLTVLPGGRVAAPHHHPTLTERFLVMEGQIAFLLDGERVTLGPGDHATIEPNVVHDWWQVGEAPAEVVAEVSPGTRFSEMVSTLFLRARQGKVDAKGMPSPLQLAVFGSEYSDVIAFESPPAIVQRLTVPPMAFIGRRRGLVACDPAYRDVPLVDADPRALAELTEDGRLRPFI